MATLLELLEKNGNLSVESNSIQDDLKKEKDLIKESYVSSLEAILEMVENDSLNEEENSELIESIDIIFNNILDGDGDEDEDEDEDGDEDEDEDCECDGEDENCECDDDDLDEAMLHRTSAKKRKAARRYARSAAGKKAKKIAAKKRRKYANKISRCKSKGKTFSLKKMTCVKSKTRR